MLFEKEETPTFGSSLPFAHQEIHNADSLFFGHPALAHTWSPTATLRTTGVCLTGQLRSSRLMPTSHEHLGHLTPIPPATLT